MTDTKRFNELFDELVSMVTSGHAHVVDGLVEQLSLLAKDCDDEVVTTKNSLVEPLVSLYKKGTEFKNENRKLKMQLHPGNKMEFHPSTITPAENSPLKDKTVIYLGSSVTYGAGSLANSFIEYSAAKYGYNYIKEAVSGTTLVDQKAVMGESYVTRMKWIDTSTKADLFICQLSTNDATTNKPLGEIAEGFDMESFDSLTITGAMEYIIAYAKKIWNCPVAFYTGTYYDSENYKKMVERLFELAKKWDIDVIDLWYDKEMLAVSKDDYDLYMTDPIHPAMAGYKLWWTPKFEEYLLKKLG